MLYSVLAHKDMDVYVFINVLNVMKSLLNKVKHITRDELELDWKPLHDIWYYHNSSSMAKNGMIYSPKSLVEPLSECIRLCSKYFPKKSTNEIWKFARPYLFSPYPYSYTKHDGLKLLKLLLPYYYNNFDEFNAIVWPYLIEILNINTWISNSENNLMVLLSRAATTFVGQIDWSPYYDRLFTALLRSLKIRVAGVNKKSKFINTKLYVDILIYSIYGNADDCEVIKRFKQLFQAINHLYHPSSQAQSSSRIVTLLHFISSALVSRYQTERVKRLPENSFGFYPTQFFLNKGHIRQMTEILLPSCKFVLFSKKTNDFGLVLHSIQKLACLDAELIVPACLQLFHDDSTSDTAILQPHRALSTLAVVSLLHVPLLNRPSQFDAVDNIISSYPEGKLAVFPLMRQLLTYININDPPKSYVALLCFGNLANMLWMEDLSSKANDSNLSEFEKKVALATAQFEDLVLQFFDKIFEIIEIGFTETGMVETQRNSDFKFDTLIDAIVMTIPNISVDLSRQVLDKTLDFIMSHSFSSQSIQSFIGAVFSCLLEKDDLLEFGFNKFMPKYMKYFRELIADDYLILSDKLDFKFVWLTNILRSFIRNKIIHKFKDNLLEVMSALFNIYTKESIRLFNDLFMYAVILTTQPITSLEHIYYLKDRNFHLSKWMGVIRKSDLIDGNLLDNQGNPFSLKYILPGQLEEDLFDQLILKFVRPSIDRLVCFTNLLNQQNNCQKLANQELKFICMILYKTCSYICDCMVYVNEDFYQFDQTIYGSISTEVIQHNFHIFIESTKPESLININHNKLIKEIRSVVTNTLTVLCSRFQLDHQDSNSNHQLPTTLIEIKELFRLITSCFSFNKITPQIQSKLFLDRRFESFVDPVMKKANTALNWVLLFDSYQLPNPLIYQDSGAQKPLTLEVVEIVKLLFKFVVDIPNSTLQQYSIDCLFNLTQIYIHLDEYIVQYCYQLIVIDQAAQSTTQQKSEHIHNGVSHLLLKILKYRSSMESLHFVYKLIPIFVCLSKTQHTEQRTNSNWSTKMFHNIVHYITTFHLSNTSHNNIVSLELSKLLRQTSVIKSNKFGDLVAMQKMSVDVVKFRQDLYYKCVDTCLSCYLIDNINKDESKLLRYALTSTSTWQNILQMSVVLPLHPELPIPVRFLELFLIIIFSPSKELSSQACNQINIVIWLLKSKLSHKHIEKGQLPIPEPNDDTKLIYGPRESSKFLTIDTDTDYWDILNIKSTNCQILTKHFNDGYLWWPQQIKLRTNQILNEKSQLLADNDKSWKLLCDVFETPQFHKQLYNFLIDLGSQFLREEETSTSLQNSLSNMIHQFSLEHLIDSIFICIGPIKGLPLVLDTYNQLMTCTGSNQVYANKLAVKLISGILYSSKIWSTEDTQKFFQVQILTIVEKYIDNSAKSESLTLTCAILDCCHTTNSVDLRMLLPLYRHLIGPLSTRYAHDASRELACIHFILGFVKLTSWRVGPKLVNDLLDLWRKFVCSNHEKLRKYAAKIARYLTILPDLTNNFHLFPKDDISLSLIKFPDELRQCFAKYTHIALLEKGLEPSIHTLRALKLDTENHDETNDTQEASSITPESTPTVSGTTTPLESPANELVSDSEYMQILDDDEDDVLDPSEPTDTDVAAAMISVADDGVNVSDQDVAAHKIIATMISSLTELFNKLEEFVPISLLDLFSIILDLIPIRDKMLLYSHLRHCALVVSSLMLTDEYEPNNSFTIEIAGKFSKIKIKSLLHFFESATQHRSWRIRVVAAKMIQIVSFNNLFVVSRQHNLDPLMTCVFRLLGDHQIEVRNEAGNILSGLIQCGLFKVTEEFIREMTARVGSRESLLVNMVNKTNIKIPHQKSKMSSHLVTAHSGVVGLCAFIQAHPFDIPPLLPRVLSVLCSSVTRPEPISSTVKDTLAKFKKSHQESWHLERQHFTEDQLCALTDVLISPSYYA